MKTVTINVQGPNGQNQTITVTFSGNVMPQNLDTFINTYVGERPVHEERR